MQGLVKFCIGDEKGGFPISLRDTTILAFGILLSSDQCLYFSCRRWIKAKIPAGLPLLHKYISPLSSDLSFWICSVLTINLVHWNYCRWNIHVYHKNSIVLTKIYKVFTSILGHAVNDWYIYLSRFKFSHNRIISIILT
jgi:hypothetical protein